MMINTNKLLSRETTDKSILSEKTVTNIKIIKKDVKKIDSLLKEKLVLSKVRQGILNRQAEQLRRRQREDELEKDVEDDNPRITFSQEPQKQKRGGLFTTLFVGLIGGIGFIVMKSLPIFKTIGRALRAIASPFLKLFTVLGRLVGALVDKVKVGSDNLKDVSKKNKKDLDQLPSRIERVGNDLQLLAGVMVANATIAAIFQGLGARKVTQVVNAARSQRLMTPVQANAVKKAMKESAVAETVEGMGSFRQGRKITKNFTKNVIREVAGSVKKKSMATVEEGSETLLGGGTGRNISKAYKKSANNFIQELGLDPELGKFGGRINTGAVSDITPRGPFGVPGGRIGPPLGGIMGSRPILPDDPLFIREGVDKAKRLSLIQKLNSDLALRIPYRVKQDLLKMSDADFMRFFADQYGFDPSEGFGPPQGDIFKPTKPKPTTRFGVPGGQIGPDFPSVAAKKQRFFFGRGSATGANPFTGAPTFQVNPRGRTIDPTTGAFFAKRSRTAKVAADTLLDASKTVAGRTALRSLGFVSKNVIRQSLGAVPLLGDLAVLLLDIYVFGEIPARAGFKTIGSIIGSIIGGILGSLLGPVGTIVGAVVGGIGGDILGAVTYDFFERRANYGPYNKQVSRTKLSKSDIARAGLSGSVKSVTVKDLGGDFLKNEIALNKGDNEYIFDSNTTEAFKQFAPGALEAANRESGKAAIEALTAKLPKKKGKTKTILLPVMMPTENSEEQQILMVNKKSNDGNFLSIVTQSRYMRA